ncbi:glycosyltransferase [Cyclobacterium sp.]|uniref:glycosyltransferase family 2 protein n=1 Tax=Cyclobacterium sp. TaxID=1966343 RepID=UPI0019CF0081|nr:glycosyltransferase [Cyclobacterium sp.]MBD3628121.1 glycosyltransferase [Cyclobacterium sp.]
MERKHDPLVSVICTCHNQGAYVIQTLNSVLDQSYKKVEIFIIDNGSNDESRKLISTWIQQHENRIAIHHRFYESPVNYCQAFNAALASIKGDYLVDLAADDYLHPEHLFQALEQLLKAKAKVYFCNALLEYPDGSHKPFYPFQHAGKIPTGDVFASVVRKYVISSVTLVMETNSFLNEGGYDEKLSYEDFDILVRMSRKYPFVYGDFIGVYKRELPGSLSTRQYQARHSALLPSTLRVCEKIYDMVANGNEREALKFRLLHEVKHSLASANFKVAGKFLSLYRKLSQAGLRYFFFRLWYVSRLDVSGIYTWWIKKNRLG